MLTAAAFAEGEKLRLNPLTVAVMDPGGHLISLQRQDRSSTLRPQIACAKAGGALGVGVSSRKIGEMATERPTFVGLLGPIAPQGVIAGAGGIIIVDAENYPIGAVGITGDTSDNDELCAYVGIAAAGLLAQG